MKPKRLPGFRSFLCPYKKPENWRKANQGNFYGQTAAGAISLPSRVMNHSSRLKCSSCGFSVFNRRYPNCERCGAELPQEVAYSREEVAALRKLDMDEELARRAEKRPPPPGKSDDDSWLYFSSSDNSCSTDGGSADGGSCSGAD